MTDETVLVTDAWETDEWFESKDYGHAVPAELWAEWKSHYARLVELADEFSKCPRVDNRPPRTTKPGPMEMHIRPELMYDQLADVHLGKERSK